MFSSWLTACIQTKSLESQLLPKLCHSPQCTSCFTEHKIVKDRKLGQGHSVASRRPLAGHCPPADCHFCTFSFTKDASLSVIATSKTFRPKELSSHHKRIFISWSKFSEFFFYHLHRLYSKLIFDIPNSIRG